MNNRDDQDAVIWFIEDVMNHVIAQDAAAEALVAAGRRAGFRGDGNYFTRDFHDGRLLGCEL